MSASLTWPDAPLLSPPEELWVDWQEAFTVLFYVQSTHSRTIELQQEHMRVSKDLNLVSRVIG